MQTKAIRQCVEDNKKNELKIVKVDVVANFVKDKVERSSNGEVYTDDNDNDDVYKEYKIIRFR